MFTFTPSSQIKGWIYGTIDKVKGSEVDLIPWAVYFVPNKHTSIAWPIEYFTLEDQQYIKTWAAQHPHGLPVSSATPTAPTGVAMRFAASIDGLVDTSGVLKGRTITAIAHNGDSTLALCSDGALVAWGSNKFGELGNGQHEWGNVESPCNQGYAISPVLVHRPGAFKDKKVIAIGFEIALCSDGSLYKWGMDAQSAEMLSKRQPGQPFPSITTVDPTLYNAGALKGRKILAIAPAGSNCLAWCSDGALIGWGSGFDGGWRPPGFDPVHTFVQEPIVLDTRKLLVGKTVVTLTSRGMLCSDGTLAMWHNSKAPDGRGELSQLYLVKMDGILKGKTVTAIAETSSIPLALCSDGTLVAWGGKTETPKLSAAALNQAGQSRLAAEAHSLAAVDAASTTILPEDVSGDLPPHILSGTGVLEGKTVTAIASYLIQCSDGTQVYWSGLGPAVVAEMGGAIQGKTILAIDRGIRGSPANTANTPGLILFKEPDAVVPPAQAVAPLAQSVP